MAFDKAKNFANKFLSYDYYYYFFTLLSFIQHTHDKSKLINHIFKLKNAQQSITIKLNGKFIFEVRDLSDLFVLHEVFFDRCYDFLFKNLNQNTTFIDLGGYIGDSALYASQFDKIKQIIIVEPAPYNIIVLKRNLSLNNLPKSRYELIEQALAPSDEKVTLYEYLHKARTGINRYHDALKSFSVQAIMLHELLAKVTTPAVVIKCDIEGAEYGVFQNESIKLLKRINRLVIEYHMDSPSLKRLVQHLRQAGFIVIHSPDRIKPNIGFIYGQNRHLPGICMICQNFV